MTLPPQTDHPAADTPESRRYNRIHRILSIADAGLGLLMLVVILVTGFTADIRDFAFGMSGGANYVLALLIYVFILSVLAKVIGLPLDIYSYRLEREYHLSTQRFGGWAWDQVKGFLVGFGISTLLTQVLYLFIRKQPDIWWITTWLVFLVLFVVFAQLAPVILFPLFYRFKTLEDERLRARLTSLSEKAGTRVRGVYEWKLSEKSNKANAALMGLGATRRIVLADTLLQNYSDDEIEAVLAHELGHHVHKHIAKSIIVQAFITFIGFWVVKTVLRQFATDMFISQADFANLPLIVLVTTVMSLILLPVMNAYSRYNERQADRYAWKSIKSIKPFVSAMNKLAQQNLAEREPSRWVEVLFHSHPPISKRLTAAQRWAESKR